MLNYDLGEGKSTGVGANGTEGWIWGLQHGTRRQQSCTNTHEVGECKGRGVVVVTLCGGVTSFPGPGYVFTPLCDGW